MGKSIDNAAVARASTLASKLHEGQKDKGGIVYWFHVERVAKMVRCAGGDTEQIQIAFLHDVVEDTDITLDDLRRRGFSERVVAGVDAMSRRERESNREYVLRVAANADAVLVKRCDYFDNMDPGRMAMLAPDVAKSLVSQMADSQKILGKALIARAESRRERERELRRIVSPGPIGEP